MRCPLVVLVVAGGAGRCQLPYKVRWNKPRVILLPAPSDISRERTRGDNALYSVPLKKIIDIWTDHGSKKLGIMVPGQVIKERNVRSMVEI